MNIFQVSGLYILQPYIVRSRFEAFKTLHGHWNFVRYHFRHVITFRVPMDRKKFPGRIRFSRQRVGMGAHETGIFSHAAVFVFHESAAEGKRSLCYQFSILRNYFKHTLNSCNLLCLYQYSWTPYSSTGYRHFCTFYPHLICNHIFPYFILQNGTVSAAFKAYCRIADTAFLSFYLCSASFSIICGT